MHLEIVQCWALGFFFPLAHRSECQSFWVPEGASLWLCQLCHQQYVPAAEDAETDYYHPFGSILVKTKES